MITLLCVGVVILHVGQAAAHEMHANLHGVCVLHACA